MQEVLRKICSRRAGGVSVMVRRRFGTECAGRRGGGRRSRWLGEGFEG